MKLGDFFAKALAKNSDNSGNYVVRLVKQPNGNFRLKLTDPGAAILSSWINVVLSSFSKTLSWNRSMELNHFVVVNGSVHVLVKPSRGNSDSIIANGKRLAYLIEKLFSFGGHIPVYFTRLLQLLRNMNRGTLQNVQKYSITLSCATMTPKGRVSFVQQLKNKIDSWPEYHQKKIFIDALKNLKWGSDKHWLHKLAKVPILHKVGTFDIKRLVEPKQPTDVSTGSIALKYQNTPEDAFLYIRNFGVHAGKNCQDAGLPYDDGSELLMFEVFGEFLQELIEALLATTLIDEIVEILLTCLPSPLQVGDLSIIFSSIEVQDLESILQDTGSTSPLEGGVIFKNDPLVPGSIEECADLKFGSFSDQELQIANDQTTVYTEQCGNKATLNDISKKSHLNIVVIGKPKSGKSTITGHLICKLGGIDKCVTEKINEGLPNYACILDKLKAERERGATDLIPLWKFETTKYCCTIVEAPGTSDFVGDRITSIWYYQADCALLMIDCSMSSLDVCREHLLLAKAFGVKQMICCCNKLDLTDYREDYYHKVVQDLSSILKEAEYIADDILFIPMSCYMGENMMEKPTETRFDWYKGPTLLEALAQINEPKRPSEKPMRLPLWEVYHTHGMGTVVMGRLASGILTTGMIITFGPTRLTTEVSALMTEDNVPVEMAIPGDNIIVSLKGVLPKVLKSGYVASSSQDDLVNGPTHFISRLVIINDWQIFRGYTATLYCHTFSCTVKLGKLITKTDELSEDELQEKLNFLQKEYQAGGGIADFEDFNFPNLVNVELTNDSVFLNQGDVVLAQMIPSRPMVVDTVTNCPILGRVVVCNMEKVVAVGVVERIGQEIKMIERTSWIKDYRIPYGMP